MAAGKVAIKAGQKASDVMLKLVRNKWFWIAIVVIVAILLVRKNWNYINAKLFQRDFGDYEGGKISNRRKEELEELAEQVYDAIYGIQIFKDATLNKLMGLSDDDLRYTAKYYQNALTRKNSLYKDVDDEIMPLTSVDEKLLRRLAKLGLKK